MRLGRVTLGLDHKLCLRAGAVKQCQRHDRGDMPTGKAFHASSSEMLAGPGQYGPNGPETY
jgi:hypothetical protein